MSPAIQPRAAETSPRRSSSCFGVFKKFGKSAWKKVGGSNREGRAGPQVEPPISSVVVDEDRENAPPTTERYAHVQQRHDYLLTRCSGILEVDSKDVSEFDFEATPPQYFGGAAYRERMAALCARYGLPQEAEIVKSASIDSTTRVPRTSRQRVRTNCHVCDTVFKGEKSCAKCGHFKCGNCKRQSITASPPPSVKAGSIIVDVDSESENDDTGDRDDALMKNSRIQEPVVEKTNYICHKCTSKFASLTNSICPGCGHERCNRCSRQTLHIAVPKEYVVDGKEPATRQKRVYRPPRHRVRHYCESCKQMFPARTSTCATCSHRRCKSCTRNPAKKRKTRPEPASEETEALRNVEERMAGIEVPIASSSSR